jgi:hypothetical protein
MLLLLPCRGPGQIVGDTSLNGQPAVAAATVRARSRMRVLVVRPADAAALVTQPSIKAALYRTQTESSVLDALETFAAYDGEVAVIDEVRRSHAASFALANGGAGLMLMGSGIPGFGNTPGGSGQWLAPADSAGSSVLESYGSIASSLASFTSATAGQASAVAAATASRSSPLPAVLQRAPSGSSFSLPVRIPSRIAGSVGAAAAAPDGAAGGVLGGSPVDAAAGSMLLRPASRGNSFTAGPAGSTTPRGQGGLRGTSSRLGLAVQPSQQQQAGLTAAGSGLLPSPRI